MEKTMNPKVVLVGAGPGDPDLITLKGLNAIKSANVMLYDALVSKELLRYTGSDCKLIDVGKRRNRHAFSQEEINQLMVFYAIRYQHVVRLKGGDPYVFGRGHEEMEYLQRQGITVEIIPGISSAIAAPSSAGIPLTKRGVNESFWVITGTCSTGEISNDIRLASQSSATVIILMGINNLYKITEEFRLTRGATEPVAVVQNATTSDQKFVYGTIGTINQRVVENEIASPAVVIIGNVVNERLVNKVLVEKRIHLASL